VLNYVNVNDNHQGNRYGCEHLLAPNVPDKATVRHVAKPKEYHPWQHVDAEQSKHPYNGNQDKTKRDHVTPQSQARAGAHTCHRATLRSRRNQDSARALDRTSAAHNAG